MRNQFHYQNSQSYTKGFTLVELSIVLVIIGLIVSGVVGGQSLIQSANRTATVSDIDKYTTSIRAFELQFASLPGDMTDAYEYWGDGGAVCDDLIVSFVNQSGCNGDGDGSIKFLEINRAWQHLSLAEVIPGSYSGVYGDYSLEALHAAHPISGAGGVYTLYGSGSLFIGGSADITGNIRSFGGIFTSADAKKIDNKLDDGVAGTGSVLGRYGYIGTWSQRDCLDSGNYDLTLGSDDGCTLSFVMGGDGVYEP